MNILHVTKKYPHALGGDAVVVSHLEAEQKKAGHTVTILTSRCDDIIRARHVYMFGLSDTAEALDSITIRRLLSLVSLFFVSFAFLRRHKPDVIHTHSVDMAFFVSFAARLYGIPLIHTFHIVTFYNQAQHVIRRKTELWLARQAHPTSVTAPNNFDVEQLREHGLPQATVLPNGVDISFWRPPSPPQKTDAFTFFSVGRLEHQKGYPTLLEAVAELKADWPGAFRVLVAGEGSQKTQLASYAKSHDLEDIVQFVGRKSPDEIRTLLHNSQAAIFPSLYETTPLTLLEAWAAGLPVIMTPVGILRGASINFDAAFVTPIEDATQLAKTMRHCLEDETHRRQVAVSGQQEATKYAWPAIAEQAEQLYRGAL